MLEIVKRKGETVHHESRARIVRAIEVGIRKPMAIAREAGLGYNDLIDLLIEEKQAVRQRAFQEGYKAGRRGPWQPPPLKAA